MLMQISKDFNKKQNHYNQNHTQSKPRNNPQMIMFVTKNHKLIFLRLS